jgi:hypothetical protein
MGLKKIIKLWHEHNVDKIDYEFDCGGDQMNETNLIILDKNDKVIECSKIEDYFESEIYNNVDFYVNSDGHYMGESGHVYVTLNDEGDDFDFTKSSTEEYNETNVCIEYIELTEEEVEYINLYVANMENSWGGGDATYKNDFIKTDRHEEIEKAIIERINQFWEDYNPVVVGNLNDDDECTWDTNDAQNDEVIEIKDNKLKVKLFYTSTVSRDGGGDYDDE